MGESITTGGYPSDLGFISVRGYIAGGEEKRFIWPNSWVFDAPGMPGVSGSAVYSSERKVIGLFVGLVKNIYSIMTPVEKICAILPREVDGR